MQAESSASESADEGKSSYTPNFSAEPSPSTARTSLPLSVIEKQYAAQPASLPRRIHIVGTGSIGKLVAHSLRSIPDAPPVTLIFHRFKLLKAWKDSKRVVSVQDGDIVTEQRGYEVELMPEVRVQHGVRLDAMGKDLYETAEELGVQPHVVAQAVREEQADREYKPLDPDSEGTADSDGGQNAGGRYVSNEPIHNLIVTTKTIRTIAALSLIKHRLSRESTICFLHNGIGVIEEVNEQVFPDEATRPNYIQGIVSHGANSPPEKAEHDPFFVVHAGHGTIALGAVPRQPLHSDPARPPTPTGFGTDNDGKLSEKEAGQLSHSARYLLRTITRCPVLCAVGFTPIELFQLQLEKLAINSILNPLTSLLDHRNGALVYNFAITRTMRLMLAETSLVIRSLPELRGIPNVPNRFSAERLETLAVAVANKTRNNISSMLADLRAGRETEIDYINGYIVKRGEEMGIKAVVNYAIMQVVKGKTAMVAWELSDSVPMAGKGEGINRE